jgi:predicted oxidoreductase
MTFDNGVIHVIDQVLIPETKVSEPLTPSRLIELAIERGVPVFNAGDVAGCAAIYEITIEALRSMESVPDKSRVILAKAIKTARAETSARKRAWILREAIDGTWTNLNAK